MAEDILLQDSGTEAADDQSSSQLATSSVTFTIKIVDVIPVADSAETDQNSEPSLAVNPTNANQIMVGAFTDTFSSSGVVTPYFLTTNGGTTWSDYGSLGTYDKSLAWSTDGSTILTAALTSSQDIQTYSGTTSGSFGVINTYAPKNPDELDQPWIRTGPSGHVYVAYNNLNNATTTHKTASVNVSTDGGKTFTPVVIDQVGAASGQDAPSVRTAVNGSTVYAVFTRWNSTVENDSNGERFNSQVVVVRDDNGGADSFKDLGSGGAGTIVASPIGVFSNSENTSLTLGQERTSSDVAIAVDPNNANHVVIAYSNASGANGSGQLQLIVAESTDGGATWMTKYTTSSTTRSGQPALAISSDGTIGFLYDNYDPATDKLSQHLLTTSNDFATTTDTVLATEKNSTPIASFDPYLGDFFDLEAVGTTFYGVFSASNADDGTDATILNVTYQRDYTGTPGTASFQLVNGSGTAVASSIDPYFFTVTENPCFRGGTLILTETGEVAVETLAIGDRVLSLSGVPRPIRWIGRRAYDGRFIKGNSGVLPIRISVGALSDGVPARDLWVSPEHALYIDGMLVPARLLVNGMTITQVERVERLQYFHLELETHDVILADGAPAETFVDCDNRLMFANGAESDGLDPHGERPHWVFCAPRLESGDSALTAICARLLARAELLGCSRSPEPADRNGSDSGRPDLPATAQPAANRRCR